MTYWQKKSSGKKTPPVWAVGLCLGLLFLGLGIYEGDLTAIYKKAVMICLECIGIG